MMTAAFYGAFRVIAVDLDDNRLALAKNFGATGSVIGGSPTWKKELMAMPADVLGVAAAIEAVVCRRPSRWPLTSSVSGGPWSTWVCAGSR